MPGFPVSYFRNFIFGVEDSLVSTVGLLSGVAVAGMAPQEIFVAGMVLIFVEAFSMGAGSLLSEHSAEGYSRQTEQMSVRSFTAAVIMFGSYFVCGFIPLVPYLLFSGATAFWSSIGVSLVALIILGLIGGKVSRVSMWRNAVRMLVIGGCAVGLGVGVGFLLG